MRLRLPRDEMVDQVHDLRGDHQSRATMNRRIFHGAACLWIVCSSGTASGHEPLFMMSHEAPGKGASDVHLAIHGERTPARDETEFELEYTRGLTRNLAVKVGIPLVREEERIADVFKGDTGVGDPSVRIKWRFWDRDVLGAKYAVALMVHSTIPVGEGPARRGHERPSILWGLSHGRESLAWYYFVDMRYRYRVADGGTKPGDRLFLDFSPGWRPYLGGIEDTDVVLFLEFNYVHAFADRADRKQIAQSGGSFFLARQ